MERTHLLYLMVKDYLDSSWIDRPWSVPMVYHFRWLIVGLFTLFRGVLYQLMWHLCPSWVHNDTFHIALTHSGINTPIFFTILMEVTFCTIVQYLLSSTFHRPLQFWEVINKVIYGLEKIYLDNFNSLRSNDSRKMKRWISSYRDEEIIWKTSKDYNRVHNGRALLFAVHVRLFKIILQKINQIEFAFFILTTCLDVLYVCVAIFIFIVILPMLKYIVLDIFTIIHLLILLPHMCYSVCSFMVIMSYMVVFSTKLHINYVYLRLNDFSRRRKKLVKVFSYAKTEITLITRSFMLLSKENGQLLLTICLLMNMPTNMFLLNYLLLVEMDTITQIITINIIIVQLLGMLIISLSIASISKTVHAHAPLFVRVQGRVHNVRTKLAIMRLFEMMHTKKIISVSLGPVEKVNFMCVFQLFTMYIAQFLLVQQFIRDYYLI